MKIGDLIITLRTDVQANEQLRDTLEIITDKLVAYEHACICAGLAWPYHRPVARRKEKD